MTGIKAGESKSVRIKVPMKAVKHPTASSIQYESTPKISVVNPEGKVFIKDIPIVITKEANKYNIKVEYDNIISYITGIEEEFPNGSKFYDFNITLILNGFQLNYSSAEVIAVE